MTSFFFRLYQRLHIGLFESGSGFRDTLEGFTIGFGLRAGLFRDQLQNPFGLFWCESIELTPVHPWEMLRNTHLYIQLHAFFLP